jgi:GTPase KRas
MLRVKRAQPVFYLVGNKCDKEYEREVQPAEGRELARAFGCPFLETSAKTATNVEALFTNLVRSLRESDSLDARGPAMNSAMAAPPPGKPKKKSFCSIL